MAAAVKDAVHPSAAVVLVHPATGPMAPKMPVLAFPLSVVGPTPVPAGGILVASLDFALALSLRPARSGIRIPFNKCVQETTALWGWQFSRFPRVGGGLAPSASGSGCGCIIRTPGGGSSSCGTRSPSGEAPLIAALPAGASSPQCRTGGKQSWTQGVSARGRRLGGSPGTFHLRTYKAPRRGGSGRRMM
jgi:hypothetical protein